VQVDSSGTFASSAVGFLERARPQLYANRDTPACFRQAVRCSSLRSSSVLYPRTPSILRFFLHNVFNTVLDLLCPSLARASSIDTSGHAGYHSYTIIDQFIASIILSKPVSQWRYRWFLIPLQLFAALNILLVAYSRVYEGSHWLTDALGGYLMGALFLALLIFLYRWTLDRLAKRHDKRLVE
jgi:hypothetical protein